ARGAVEAVELGLQLEVLAAGRVGIGAGLLPDDPDRAADGLRFAHDVESRHARLAAVGARERGQGLHRGRFAGAVGAEPAEYRPRLDLEPEAGERTNAPLVRLLQV